MLKKINERISIDFFFLSPPEPPSCYLLLSCISHRHRLHCPTPAHCYHCSSPILLCSRPPIVIAAHRYLSLPLPMSARSRRPSSSVAFRPLPSPSIAPSSVALFLCQPAVTSIVFRSLQLIPSLSSVTLFLCRPTVAGLFLRCCSAALFLRHCRPSPSSVAAQPPSSSITVRHSVLLPAQPPCCSRWPLPPSPPIIAQPPSSHRCSVACRHPQSLLSRPLPSSTLLSTQLSSSSVGLQSPASSSVTVCHRPYACAVGWPVLSHPSSVTFSVGICFSN